MTVQIVTSLRDRGGKVVPESYADMLDGTNALVLATVAGGAGDRFISAGRDRGNAAIAERWADQGDGTFARVVSLAAGSGGGFTPNVATAGKLVFSDAASQVVPGTTSWALRDHANANNNLIVTDAGNATLRGGLTLPAGAISATAPAGSGSGVAGSGFLYTTGAGGGGNDTGGPVTINLGIGTGTGAIGQFAILPPAGNVHGANAGTIHLGNTSVLIMPASPNTTQFAYVQATFIGVDNTLNNSARAFVVDTHYTGTVNGTGTHSAGYFNAYHDGGTGVVITDFFGLIGRAYVTSTGTATNAWGVRGDVNLMGAATVGTQAFAIFGKAPQQFAGSTIPIYAGVYADAVTMTTTTAQNVYGGWFGIPSGGVSNNIGLAVGVSNGKGVTSGAYIRNGLILSGLATGPIPVDTSSGSAALSLAAGDNAGTKTTGVNVYFYRGATVAGYLGFNGDIGTYAGHVKTVDDFAIATHTQTIRAVIDNSSNLWMVGAVNAGIGLGVIQTISTSATPTAMETLTGGAHTTLVSAEVKDVSWNLARTVQFTGSATLALQRSIVIAPPTFTSDTATKAITAATTMAITGPPVASTNVTLTAPNNSSLWLASGIATVAGGSLAAALAIGATASVPTMGIYWGSGAPTIAAPAGSLYLCTNGSTGTTRAYINTTGSTTWTAINTVA